MCPLRSWRRSWNQRLDRKYSSKAKVTVLRDVSTLLIFRLVSSLSSFFSCYPLLLQITDRWRLPTKRRCSLWPCQQQSRILNRLNKRIWNKSKVLTSSSITHLFLSPSFTCSIWKRSPNESLHACIRYSTKIKNVSPTWNHVRCLGLSC